MLFYKTRVILMCMDIKAGWIVVTSAICKTIATVCQVL